MKKYYVYFYYRSYQLYHGSVQFESPVSMLVSVNIAFVVNVVFRFLNFLTWGRYGDFFLLTQVVSDFAIFIFSLVIGAIVYSKRRKFFNKEMASLKTESEEERRRNGWGLVFYIVCSVLLLVGSYFV